VDPYHQCQLWKHLAGYGIRQWGTLIESEGECDGNDDEKVLTQTWKKDEMIAHPSTPDTDDVLVQRAQLDPNAFGLLYARYARDIQRLPYLCERITEATTELVWRERAYREPVGTWERKSDATELNQWLD
jgi:hypothetical protein